MTLRQRKFLGMLAIIGFLVVYCLMAMAVGGIVFVGSGVFTSEHPASTANAIVQATTHYDEPRVIAEVSRDLGSPMRSLRLLSVPVEERLAVRGS